MEKNERKLQLNIRLEAGRLAASVPFFITCGLLQAHRTPLLLTALILSGPAVLNCALYRLCHKLRHTKWIDNDVLYTATLLWKRISAALTGCLLYTAAHTSSASDRHHHSSSSSIFVRLTLCWLVLVIVQLLQRALLFYISSVTIWAAYLERIKMTVIAHEVLAGIRTYAAKHRSQLLSLTALRPPPPLPNPKSAAAAPATTVHKRKATTQDILRKMSTVVTAVPDTDDTNGGGAVADEDETRTLSSIRRGVLQFSHETVPLHKVHKAIDSDLTAENVLAEQLFHDVVLCLQHFSHQEHKQAVMSPKRRFVPAATTMLPTPPPPPTTPLPQRRQLHHHPVLTADDMNTIFCDKQLADIAMSILDSNGNDKIEQNEFIAAFDDIVQSRASLNSTLADYERMVGTLNTALTVVSSIAVFFSVLIVFHINVIQNTTLILSSFLAMSIVFGSTLTRFFEGLVLVFSIRPFDVADVVYIRNEQQTEHIYTVLKMSLLTTTFLRADGHNVSVSNFRLKDSFIVNWTRSGQTTHQVSLRLPCSTPLSFLDALQTRLQSLDLPQLSSISTTLESVRSDGLSLQVSVFATHVENFQNLSERFALYDQLTREIAGYCHEHCTGAVATPITLSTA